MWSETNGGHELISAHQPSKKERSWSSYYELTTVPSLKYLGVGVCLMLRLVDGSYIPTA